MTLRVEIMKPLYLVPEQIYWQWWYVFLLSNLKVGHPMLPLLAEDLCIFLIQNFPTSCLCFGVIHNQSGRTSHIFVTVLSWAALDLQGLGNVITSHHSRMSPLNVSTAHVWSTEVYMSPFFRVPVSRVYICIRCQYPYPYLSVLHSCLLRSIFFYHLRLDAAKDLFFSCMSKHRGT